MHKNAIMFLQPPVMFIPPVLHPTELDDRLVFSPHYYDGLTLMLKKWYPPSRSFLSSGIGGILTRWAIFAASIPILYLRCELGIAPYVTVSVIN